LDSTYWNPGGYNGSSFAIAASADRQRIPQSAHYEVKNAFPDRPAKFFPAGSGVPDTVTIKQQLPAQSPGAGLDTPTTDPDIPIVEVENTTNIRGVPGDAVMKYSSPALKRG